ncbi:helix-turn-helix domain-containing protein [Novosphingobium lentum]|uniref:AraC-like ligand-binding domain-containing protein n=1 Tax=Novosphingobium lentum TaxID=145287 RepID=UPI0008375739|nr:helix-turn-helix domain-containing protein [Novosphingobium lentum]
MRRRRLERTGDFVPIAGGKSAWEAGLSDVFVELEFQQVDPAARLVGRMYPYPFGDLTFIRAVTRGGAHRVIRSARTIAQSSHNNYFIGFLLAGEATLSQAGHQADLQPGDIAILDSTREYTIEVPRSFDALWVRVPRYRLEGRLRSSSDVMAQRLDGSAGTGHVASTMLHTALEEAPRIEPAEANRIANHLLDLIAMSLGNQVGTSPDRTSNHQKSTLRRIQEYIEQRLDDEDLSPSAIAGAHGVSIRYVNKLFEREGASVARWIRTRRLENCRADIEDPDKSALNISEIAYQHGFGNISNFNRAFRSRFGVSPRALRGDARQR